MFKPILLKKLVLKKEIKISARFWPIFDFELNEKGHEPSRAENHSARVMAQASLARTHH